MKLENLLALRYLKARKRNKLLSFLSVTSVVGVMLGVAILIVVICVMTGFSENLREKLLGANAHIIVSRADSRLIDNWTEYAEKIRNVPGVNAVAPFVLGQVMISSDRNISGVVVRGVSPALEKHTGKLHDFVVSGSMDNLSKTTTETLGGVFIGEELAISLGVSVGDVVTLINPVGAKSAFGIMPKMRKFAVAGTFDTGIYEYNKTLIYIDILEAQDFFAYGEKISGFNVNVVNQNKADMIAADIQAALGYPYWARDWLRMNSNLFAALKLEQVAMFVILTLIIIVASFNIVSMISILVKDKRKDIAIIRAMGGSEKLIRQTFMRLGVGLGLVGTILGNLLALIICYVVKNYKIIDIPKDVYFSDSLPVKLDPMVFLAVTAAAMVITFIAAIIPARMSAKVDPIEAMRND